MPTGIIGAQRHWALHFVREAMLKSRRDMRESTRCDVTECRCTERMSGQSRKPRLSPGGS